MNSLVARLLQLFRRLAGPRPYSLQRAAKCLRANGLARGGRDDAAWWWLEQETVGIWRRCRACGELVPAEQTHDRECVR